MTMLAAALCAEASDIARTADEANRMALAGVEEEVAFDITATVATPVFHSAVGSFEIVDGSGYATVNARRLFAQGRHVEVGDLMRFKGAIRTVEEMSVVGRGTIPDPEDVSAADVFSGRFTSHRVRLDGTVVEAFRDEANPEYTFIVLVKDGDTMYFPSRSLTDADLAGYPDQIGDDPPLLVDAVILKLNKEILPAEKIAVILRLCLRALVIACGELARDLARETCGKADQALVILLKKAVVYAGLGVKALGKAL